MQAKPDVINQPPYTLSPGTVEYAEKLAKKNAESARKCVDWRATKIAKDPRAEDIVDLLNHRPSGEIAADYQEDEKKYGRDGVCCMDCGRIQD